jgi:hypothetical protein
MVVGRRAGAVALVAALGSARPTRAEEPAASTEETTSPPPVEVAEKTASARRHFKNGIKLYKDADYRGALAEFEAAYREKPGPGSLQNIALSLKALFRYAEAAESLRLLLARHGADLQEDERRAVQVALDELAALVGTLTIAVEPADATVSVNGRSLSAEERASGVSLNVGEHTVAAVAPGYARRVQVVRIASQQRVPLALKLEPTSGFLEILALDPKAAIAVNGEPLAYHRWTGPVPPDVDHTIQIYRRGFEPFETTAHVEIGQKLRISGALGPPTGEAIESAPLSSKPGAPPEPRVPKGVYVLFALGVAGVNDAPLGLEVSSGDMSFASVGGRLGYRLTQLLALDLALDLGGVEGENACERQSDGSCVDRNFSLTTLRLGPSLRLYTSGETVRFPIAIGAGVVSHRLKLEPVTGDAELRGGEASGADPYFCVELGASYNYRHLLLELGVAAFIESASELRGNFDGRGKRPAFESGTLPLLGVSLKVGYSAWAPKKRSQ